jgi:hypothetical protein
LYLAKNLTAHTAALSSARSFLTFIFHRRWPRLRSGCIFATCRPTASTDRHAEARRAREIGLLLAQGIFGKHAFISGSQETHRTKAWMARAVKQPDKPHVGNGHVGLEMEFDEKLFPSSHL